MSDGTPLWLDWLQAFLLTQLIEMPVYVLFLRSYSWPKRLVIAFGASAITHPFVWFFFPWLIPLNHYSFYFLTAETFAVSTEAVYLQILGVKRAIWVSLLANSLSAGTGLLLWWLRTRWA